MNAMRIVEAPAGLSATSRFAAVLLLVAGWASAADAGSAAAADARLQFGALGSLRVGMPPSEVARRLGSPLRHVHPDAETGTCFDASAAGLPEGVGLMFVDGRLARFDVDRPGVRTSAGAQVGSSEAAVERLYGAALRKAPNAYTGPEGHDLTVPSPDGRLGLRFETDGTRVTVLHAGTLRAIGFIEGCL